MYDAATGGVTAAFDQFTIDSMDEDQNSAPSVTARVAALAHYDILDTDPEPGFDDIVLLATRICETPVALVSLVTESRQWFKAKIGFPACETPLGQSVCAEALRQKGVFIIPDMTLDERTRHNTLVTQDPFIRFYAGAPLETPDGVSLGTLCVIDTKPRPEGLTPIQTDSLQALARQVMSQMELRRVLKARAAAEGEAKQHQEIIKNELSHRLKNILAIVHAIVSQTLRKVSNFDDAREALSSRILALAKAQDILFERTIESASLAAIVQSAAVLLPEGPDTRLIVSGPEIEVGPKATFSIALMMHELTTNAMKYGALSTPDGKVTVDWDLVATRDREPSLELLWREIGGPKVAPPTRRGFGTQLIERALADATGATITMDYQPSGLECRLIAPLTELRERSGDMVIG